MAISLLAIAGIAIVAAVLGGGKPTASSKNNQNNAEPDELPPNLVLQPAGSFQYGARIGIGDEFDDDQVVEIIDIVADRADEYPAHTFEITTREGTNGIQVIVVAGGAEYEQWAENIEYLPGYLDSLLAEHIPG